MLREHVHEPQLGGTGGEQRVEHVGVTIPQEVAQACEEGVGVADLRSAVAVPVEGAVRVRRQRRVVTLDDGDVMARARSEQRGGEPTHSGADDHDPCHGDPLLDEVLLALTVLEC